MSARDVQYKIMHPLDGTLHATFGVTPDGQRVVEWRNESGNIAATHEIADFSEFGAYCRELVHQTDPARENDRSISSIIDAQEALVKATHGSSPENPASTHSRDRR